ncbi:hypothetical protein C1645_819586 [Glomus cerebriforme]|uniref:Uncharacterized protein n=1 Tax=Glomus cerebriforme TaxID=658196 RepID=A0A397TAJ3_9GLOM|nr:hypothetical protein C1645_819586 [Glomus cerebriforme]
MFDSPERKVKFLIYYKKLKFIWYAKDIKTNYYIIDLKDDEIQDQVHRLLSENKLSLLFEKLRLMDENEYISVKILKYYMTLFDKIIKHNDNSIADKKNTIIDKRNIKEFEKNYNQSKIPDILLLRAFLAILIQSCKNIKKIRDDITVRLYH